MICWPHKNCGALGIVLFGRYIGDITIPHREGFGSTWKRFIRIYWKERSGRRHWLYLPSFQHYADRVEK